jgi:phosphoribosylglycinamide formyltransferase-1
VVHIAVLASGTGTNLQALLDDAVIGPSVTLVVSDRPQAMALDRARDRNIQTVVVEPSGFQSRESYDGALVALLQDEGIEIVVLAGFMRVLSGVFVHAYAGRVLNVHPSLLPAFPGGDSVADALAWGVKLTGVTVHLVDEEVDHGPIVLQEAVPIAPDDDWHSLEARVHEVEHRLLPTAVRAMMEDRITAEGRTARIEEGKIT